VSELIIFPPIELTCPRCGKTSKFRGDKIIIRFDECNHEFQITLKELVELLKKKGVESSG